MRDLNNEEIQSVTGGNLLDAAIKAIAEAIKEAVKDALPDPTDPQV